MTQASTLQNPQVRSTGRRLSDPSRELRIGLAVVGVFLTLGVGWAAFAPLDSAVSVQGTVKVSGDRQKVQTLREGVISGIRVSEGATVAAGQVLVEFANADAMATERTLATRAIGLQAEIARLQAQSLGKTSLDVPETFARLTGENRVIADQAMALERSQLAAHSSVRSTESAVLSQRVAQIGDQMQGFAARRRATQIARMLLEKQIGEARALAAEGYASKNRVLELERSAADLDGSIGSLASEDARLRNSEGEARLQVVLSRGEELRTAADRMREAQADLQSALPQWAAAREQLARTQLRAPVAGVVVGLAVHTIGGVAPAGQTLMEVVPLDRSLVIEGQVRSSDVNQLRVGQEARLHITALHGRSVPQLKGKVSRVSADSFVDERTGMPFYTVSISVPGSELQRLVDSQGPAGKLRPGNPVQAMITLRSRSALEYWLEPLTSAFSGSLHEQ